MKFRPLIEEIVRRKTKRMPLRTQQEDIVEDAIERAWWYSYLYDIQRGSHEAFISKVVHSVIFERARKMNHVHSNIAIAKGNQNLREDYAQQGINYEIEERMLRWLDRHGKKLPPKQRYALELMKHGFNMKEIGHLLRNYYGVQPAHGKVAPGRKPEQVADSMLARRTINQAAKRLKEIREEQRKRKRHRQGGIPLPRRKRKPR